MTLNALTFDRDILSRRCSADMIFYAGESRIDDPRVRYFPTAGSGALFGSCDGVYVPSVLGGDDVVDDAIEKHSEGRPTIVSACLTLDEVGTCDKKFGTTPVGLAHKYGLLDENTFIAGGVYLDKDDIDLIVQSGAGVILTPSDSMGSGYGIPPLRMFETLGARVKLGTGSGAYNGDADIMFERRLIYLAASGMLCTRAPVSEGFLSAMTET